MPPSSLRLWRLATNARKAPPLDVAYLGDFDMAFRNPYYFSHRDTGADEATFSPVTIAAAGVTIARAVYALAAPSSAAPLQVDAEVRG